VRWQRRIQKLVGILLLILRRMLTKMTCERTRHDGCFQLTTSTGNQALCQSLVLKNTRHFALLRITREVVCQHAGLTFPR